MTEKEYIPRIYVQWHANITIDETILETYVIEASLGGLGILSKVKIPVGKPFKITLKVNEGVEMQGEIEVLGECRHLHSIESAKDPILYRCGLKLIEIDDIGAQLLGNLK